VKEGDTEEGGIQKDISNSKRHAVFPWQLGSHGYGLAKDAISVKKIPTYTNIGAYLFLRVKTVCFSC